MSDLKDFYGPNAGYVLELYERYLEDPEAVDPATRAYFTQWSPVAAAERAAPAGRATGCNLADMQQVRGLVELVRGIREYGHLAARIDPLGSDPPGDPVLDPATHGVRSSALAELPAALVDSPLAEGAGDALAVVLALRRVYSGTTGYDFDHVQDAEERAWLQDAVEGSRFRDALTPDEQRSLLRRLAQVETFEQYLHQRFPGQKRFSIEGTDMLVPMLDEIIRLAADSGTREVFLGMAHRGRLNVLAHVLGKPYEAILSEFHDPAAPEPSVPWEGTDTGWLGDVKYHLGARMAYQAGSVVRLPITLAPNPSHLEFVNPVVEGMARSAQDRRDQPGAPRHDESTALAVLMHGDAAFPGQGVVAETLNLSCLPGYRTGGTIHIIVNNQVGFTTEPAEARSTLYASDLAKGFEIPIVHVNADDPEACLAAARLAHAYRRRFGRDFLIDVVGYRRWGHNEGDEPAFTQPILYRAIGEHPTVRQRWAQELERQGLVSADEADAMGREWMDVLDKALAAARSATPEQPERQPAVIVDITTAVPRPELETLSQQIHALPEGFNVNPRLKRLLDRRAAALTAGDPIDWAFTETLAFASLLADGTPIRLTGQDTERGTFSQRHLVLHDATTGEKYVALQALSSARAAFAVYNSPLSEMAALGFEYGYSVYAPETLVLWEAQFGDFANSAQVIIDQFITSAHAKWQQHPSLVLLLPHGYEGQGPEHSSARLERFIQLAADSNIRIANCTTAAQYFHLLRRQAALLRHDPRPLIVMTPKSLLRHPMAACRVDDLATGRFHPVLDDPDAAQRPHSVTRLVLCSGKIGIDLLASDLRPRAEHVAILRVEELYPFPIREITDALERYSAVRDIIWVQEEPRNMGAWRYMAPRLRTLAGPDIPVSYIGRARRASPAEGSTSAHRAEQARIVEAAFRGLPEPPLVEERKVQHAD